MNNKIFGYGKKKWLSLATVILAIVLPATVVASVIITYQINGSVYAAASPVVFTNGPNYATAHTLGFSTTTINKQNTQITISLGGVTGSYGTYLLDQINVTQNSKYAIANTWNVSFNVSGVSSNMPTNVFIYMIVAENATATSATSPIATLTTTMIAYGSSWAAFVPQLYKFGSASTINYEVLNITGKSVATPSATASPSGYTPVTTFPFSTLKYAPHSSDLLISFIIVIPTGVNLASLTTSPTFSVMMTVES